MTDEQRNRREAEIFVVLVAGIIIGFIAGRWIVWL